MIAIMDYGIGNLGSVKNAFDYLGFDSIAKRIKPPQLLVWQTENYHPPHGLAKRNTSPQS